MQGVRDEHARRQILRALAAGCTVVEATRRAKVARGYPYQLARRGDAEVDEAVRRAGARRRWSRAPQAPPVAPGVLADAIGVSADQLAALRRGSLAQLAAFAQDRHAPARVRVAAALALLQATERAAGA
jgi:hypothetical protein